MPTLQHEFTRVPVTALASCGALLVVAEGPFLRFYHREDSCYIASERVFVGQAVHGISLFSVEDDGLLRLVVWGGKLIRVLEVKVASNVPQEVRLDVRWSNVAKASDWILDLAPRPANSICTSSHLDTACVAVTAHNALLQVNVACWTPGLTPSRSNFLLSIFELTASSRSILYSAHVLWHSADCVLVAAGTAFGEIIYWSWAHKQDAGASSLIHRVFLGHEGSIFGVRISEGSLVGCDPQLKRIVASCSDDRTIRIWDVSDVTTKDRSTADPDLTEDIERVRHTGFSNAAFDVKPFSSSECLAIGWGHASRVWTLQFLASTPNDNGLSLLSTGEDATSRTWRLEKNDHLGANLPYSLTQQDCAAYHGGKNIWSRTICLDTSGLPHVVCGAADSKITTHPLRTKSQAREFTVIDIMSLAALETTQTGFDAPHKSSKAAEFFRSYCFIEQDSFLLTTNSGKVFVGALSSQSDSDHGCLLSTAIMVDQLDDLSGYSVSSGEPASGVAFVAGSKGSIYMYSKLSGSFSRLTSLAGKIGEMFTTSTADDEGSTTVNLLATILGQREASLLYVDIANASEPQVIKIAKVPISGQSNGAMITSMMIAATSSASFLFLGFRHGSIAVYSISDSNDYFSATLSRTIEHSHGHETVTSLTWRASFAGSASGHLISVGRNGCLAIQRIDLSTSSVEIVHNLPLPFGPNIEGVYWHQDHLVAHGFSSKRWILYDVTSEEEVMSVETGGAHRSWAFQPSRKTGGGGTLIWTRASSMHICSQTEPSHSVIRSGGHGREIKAVAVSADFTWRLIATGAEDTNIKISEYIDGEVRYQRTVRKHTTGIQHLQWSDDSGYLFSSGGCEEFYIWRISQLPLGMGIGVVCEFVYAPESEHSDLRIMSFDVIQHEEVGYGIAMVLSDSSIKTYRYIPTGAVICQTLAKGTYFTSCLTQCMFLNAEVLLTAGTDGHVVVWPRSSTDVLTWQQPVQVHQSSSKAMSSCHAKGSTRLVVSGGDDGSLAVLLLSQMWSSSSPHSLHVNPPVLLSRAHASAITACAMLTRKSPHFVLTSGNDQWVRLWKVWIIEEDGRTKLGENRVRVSRVSKIKTNVADVSSMAVLDEEELQARVLICGVGVQIIRIDWTSLT
ncbi:WD domain-containing protein [Setomelanomma holmii]|uniref:WD domain-containing protein n=1 Tax=Setomelanomma holmii TaxID=210430 RepID=A0A9P4H9J3_9PLEO|nr:WD domain-containing protein [Setomelanomma holmii]